MWVDGAAAVAFVVGSIFFLDPAQKRLGEWMFLTGSVLFALVPLTKYLQAVHLGRLSTGTNKGARRP